MNAEQKLAAHYEGKEKNLLILAGAGTGKTTTLIERIKFLIAKGVPAERILAVSFTNRSAREMKQRLRKQLGSKVDTLQVKTFHAYALSVVIDFPQFFATKRHTIIDGQDQKSLMKVILANYAKEIDVPIDVLPGADTLIEMWSYCKNTCVSIDSRIEKMQIKKERADAIKNIIKNYEAHKQARSYLDFDDLLIMFCAEIKRNPDFKDHINGLFDEILVDEFQDANPIQFFFLKLTTMRSTRLFCVGDDAQSIYGFRGADFNNIHSFVHKFPNSKVFKLIVNYRSHQESLDIANWLLKKSKVDYDKDLVSGKGSGGNKPILIDFQSPYMEASWICSEIKKLLCDDVDPGEIMVLLRSSFDGMPLRKALSDAAIRYQVIGGDNLYKTAHIKDLISVIRITTNQNDEIAWMRFLTLWKGVGASKANKVIPSILACRGNQQMINATLSNTFGPTHSVSQIYQQLQTLKYQPVQALALINRYMPEIIQIRKYDKNRERIKDVEALCEYAADFKSLDDLLDDIALEPATFSQLANKHKRNTVTLITIHSAKGTEADHCFIPHVKNGVFPNKRSKGNAEEEEEERRVAYVALTRVKKQLYLSKLTEDSSYRDEETLPAKTEEFFFRSIPQHLVNKQ